MEGKINRDKGFPYFMHFLKRFGVAKQKHQGTGSGHPAEYQQAESLGQTGQTLVHTPGRHSQAQQCEAIFQRHLPLAQ